MNWQPIETAPNNTRVLMWMECPAIGVVFGKAIVFEDGEVFYLPDGFDGPCTCTHWMPLPEPPLP